MPPIALTLGPILFHWPADDWAAFYRRVAEEPCIDRVCLGDIVCSKRWPFVHHLIPETAALLRRAGKQVVVSAPILPTLPRERALLDELLRLPDVLIEANDVSALARLSGRPHAIGPFINTYNEGTLAHFAQHGARLVCLPPELPIPSIRALAAVPGTAVEVWAFGRIPIAISARCYHARLHNRSKDSCLYACGEDRDGRPVKDLDGRPFMAINGVQTLSHAYASAIGDIEDLAAAGVRSLRLSPHTAEMPAVARLFRGVIDGTISAQEAHRRLAALIPAAAFCNGFLHGRPGHERVGPHPLMSGPRPSPADGGPTAGSRCDADRSVSASSQA